MKKLLYLFLALLLPGLIFIFLKLAGRNEFTIPIYYEDKVTDKIKGCDLTYPVPYHLPDSAWRGGKKILTANLFIFTETGFDGNKLKSALEDEMGAGILGWIKMSVDPAELEKWKCTFLLQDSWQLVLVDQEKRIRGYYNPQLREDRDRLRVELKILLKKY